jgi:hypothetical protein
MRKATAFGARKNALCAVDAGKISTEIRAMNAGGMELS